MHIPLILGSSIIDQYRTDYQGFFIQIDNFAEVVTTNAAYLAFTAALFVVGVGMKVMGSWLNLSQALYSQMLLRPVLILASIPLYNVLVDLVLITPTNAIADIMQAVGNAVPINSGGAPNNSNDYISNTCDPTVDAGDFFRLFFTQGIFEMLHLFFCLFSSAIVLIMTFRLLISSAVFHVIGPIAISMSLYPGNEGNISKWFYGYMSVLLWYPLIVIHVALLAYTKASLGPSYGKGDSNQFIDFGAFIIIDILIVYAIFQIPKMSAYIVSGHAAAEGTAGKTTRSFIKGIFLPGKK